MGEYRLISIPMKWDKHHVFCVLNESHWVKLEALLQKNHARLKKNDLFLNHSQSKSMVLFTYGRLKFVSTAVTAPVDLIKLKFEGNFSASSLPNGVQHIFFQTKT